MDESTAVRSLAALAQAQRLRIFRALVGAAPGGLTPGALAALLGTPASTLSFHLKELIHAGLVEVQREGRSLIYRPALARMDALLAYLTAHCCQGSGCGTPASACVTPSCAPGACGTADEVEPTAVPTPATTPPAA